MTRTHERFPLPAAMALLATLVSATPSPAAPHPIVDRLYHCTVISRGQDVAPLAFSATPAINAFGQVAFATDDLLGGPESEVRVGWGDTSFGVPQTRRVARGSLAGGAPFLSVGGVSIDQSGRVVFVGDGFLPSALGRGIFRVPFYAIDTTLPTPLVETRDSDPTSPFNGNLGEPLAGTRDVFFSASYYENGVPPQRAGLFQDDQLVRDGAVDGYAYDADDSGAYAFLQTVGTFPALESQLYHRTSPIDSVPATTGSISGLSVASNAFELVSYGRFEATGFEVRLHASGLATSVYVDSDDDALVAENSPGSDIPTSVNPYAEVALVAGDGDFEPRRVFVADGEFIHRVLCENDGILPVQIGTRAINAEGQIAFLGMDGNDQAVIARADPLQGLPASCVGLSAGSPCDDGSPATAAVCSAGGQCLDDPDGLPTSCQALPENSPCDDGDPETLAFCRDAQCVAVPLSVPEPGVSASLFASLAAIAASRGLRRRRQARRDRLDGDGRFEPAFPRHRKEPSGRLARSGDPSWGPRPDDRNSGERDLDSLPDAGRGRPRPRRKRLLLHPCPESGMFVGPGVPKLVDTRSARPMPHSDEAARPDSLEGPPATDPGARARRSSLFSSKAGSAPGAFAPFCFPSHGISFRLARDLCEWVLE